jgi:alpha-glucosidase
MDGSWWKGAVTYQVYPRSFQDTDGDGVGDLPGVTARLSHVADLGADAVWLSPVFRSPMADMGYDVSDYRDIDPVFGTLADFDALVARAHALGLRVVIDQVLSHSSDRHSCFAESRASRDNQRADWYVWADPRHDGTPPTNWLSVFGGPAWTWDARRRQYYLHNFLSCQPDFNFHAPAVQDWHLDNIRFWLDRGVDGLRLDTVNYYFHDPLLRDNPPDPRPDPAPEANPYNMQYHLFDKNRPETLAWLGRIRALLDGYGARMAVGEVGESHHALALMGAYTGPARLHQCYSFEMMGPDFTAAAFRDRIAAFFEGAPQGWPMWAFSNHDVPRHVTRWAAQGATPAALARLCAAMLLSFPGSICLWQGEELGQTDTDLALEELTDPQGIAFWPAPVGRDNTRTPMVWDATPQAGFTTGRPWLPVKAAQRARHAAGQAADPGSVLAFYRAMLAFRRATPALGGPDFAFPAVDEPVLALERGGGLLCLFNLSPAPQRVRLAAPAAIAGPAQAAEAAGAEVRLGPNGFAFLPGGRIAG